MKQRIFIAVFVIVCLALVAVSVDSVNLPQSERDAEKDGYQPGK